MKRLVPLDPIRLLRMLPGWMHAIAVVDPFTYAVHAFKSLAEEHRLRGEHLRPSVSHGVPIVAMTAAALLFRRTL